MNSKKIIARHFVVKLLKKTDGKIWKQRKMMHDTEENKNLADFWLLREAMEAGRQWSHSCKAWSIQSSITPS
jgi:hypothetical protein